MCLVGVLEQNVRIRCSNGRQQRPLPHHYTFKRRRDVSLCVVTVTWNQYKLLTHDSLIIFDSMANSLERIAAKQVVKFPEL